MNACFGGRRGKQGPSGNPRAIPLCAIAVCTLLGFLVGCAPATGPAGASNADLEDLTLSSGSLSPEFAADTTSYGACICNGAIDISVTPTTADPNASCDVRVGGAGWAGVSSGSPSPSLDMTVGTNTVEVRVTAEDGATTRTYTVSVERVGSDVHLVPDDYGTIQAAINATEDGDTVLVREGTYTENLTFPTDRSITVRSTHGAAGTTIDGGGSGSVVTFSTSSASSELDGFTITSGNASTTGGAESAALAPRRR